MFSYSKHLNRIFLSFLFALFLSGSLTAQTGPVYNRFQYHKYKWNVLHTPMFHLYFPKSYDSLASLASLQLPDIITEVKNKMGTGVQAVPNIIIYPSVDQLYESNIGMHLLQPQTFPTINLQGDRVMVAFDGSYEHFVRELRTAWVRICWEEQFRHDLQDQLSGNKPQMPVWFKEGCIAYVANGWDINDEDALARIFGSKPDINWEDLTLLQPRLGGAAFCYFLDEASQQGSRGAPMQVFFQLRQGKSLPRALRLVTKQTIDTLTERCLNYFQDRARQLVEVKQSAVHKVLLHDDSLKQWLSHQYGGRLKEFKFNTDSSNVVFVIEKNDRRDVYVAAVKHIFDGDKRRKALAQYAMPPWLPGHEEDNYPLVYWQQNGKMLTLAYPVKGRLQLQIFSDAGIRLDTRILYGIDGVNSVWKYNVNDWLLSATRSGRSDIICYHQNKGRYSALTKDNSDHTELLLLNADKPLILYRSGYPADSLYHPDSTLKHYGIYYKPIQATLRETSLIDDTAIAVDSAYVQWHDPVSDAAGNLFVRTTQGGTSRNVAASLRSLSDKEINAEYPRLTPWLHDYLKNIKEQDSIKALLAKAGGGQSSFLQQVLNPGDVKEAAALQRDSIRKAVAYTAKKVSPYVLQLHSAFFSASVNNDYFINRYQPYQSYLGTFKFPEVGAMINGGFSNLFENHQFNIGYRLPAGTEGSDFFVRYENDAKTTDWHLLFFRKVESLQPDPGRDWKDERGYPYPAAAKVKTHYYELGFHTPLQYNWSLDYSLAARRDQTIFLATDKYSLNYDRLQSWWGIGNIGLKVHKMQPTIPMLEKGYEGKLLLDAMGSSGKQSTLVYGAQLNLRYSLPLIKDITIVAGLQAGYSGGQSKILYNFGGIDNNIVTRVDTSVRFGQDVPYAFQTLVTPFRGYEQNSIYGTRYALVNMDLYFPLFRTLIPLHTSFSSVNNLQLGLFADLAKTGFSSDVPNAGNINDRLSSFGFSVRTMLAGYPIRFDMAWPGSMHRSPVWYLSLSL